MRWRCWLLLVFLVVPGVTGFAVCMRYAVLDWAALQAATAHFARVAAAPGDLRGVFVAEARQNIHRVNLSADVTWALLCAVVAAIGLHGVCAGGLSGKRA
jgi:hypothetical protein